MKGLRLSSLSGELYKVNSSDNKEPARSINDIPAKLKKWSAWISERFDSFDLIKDCCRLPLDAFEAFSFDELCKLHYSSAFMMHKSVGDLLERNIRYEVVRKIENSMWRWGVNKGTWNEIVDTYNYLRRFVSPLGPDFEIRLEYATYHNPCGYSKFSRTFIDGAFAFLVYYKRKHAMTIGFSFLSGKRILLQQVQSARRTGNRYLYRFPDNRLEFVIGLFKRNFPGYELYLVDGKSLMDKIETEYRDGLERAEQGLAQHQERINQSADSRQFAKRMQKLFADERDGFQERIAHLTADRERIAAFYGNTGRFKLGSTKHVCNRLVHHIVVLQKSKKQKVNYASLEIA